MTCLKINFKIGALSFLIFLPDNLFTLQAENCLIYN